MADDLGIIRVFQLDDQRIRLASELDLQSLGSSGQCGVAVLKMAFSTSQDLAVLYKSLEPTKVSEPSPFYRRAKSVPLMIVVYRPRLSPTGEVCYSIEEHGTTEIRSPPGTECVGLAVAPNGNVCVGWQSHLSHDRTDFWLIVSNSKEPSGGTFRASCSFFLPWEANFLWVCIFNMSSTSLYLPLSVDEIPMN